MGILIQCFFWMRKANKAGPIVAAKRSHRAAVRYQPRVTVDGLTAFLRFKSVSLRFGIWKANLDRGSGDEQHPIRLKGAQGDCRKSGTRWLCAHRLAGTEPGPDGRKHLAIAPLPL